MSMIGKKMASNPKNGIFCFLNGIHFNIRIFMDVRQHNRHIIYWILDNFTATQGIFVILMVIADFF